MPRIRTLSTHVLVAATLAGCDKKKPPVVVAAPPEEPSVSLAGGLPPKEPVPASPAVVLGSFGEAETALNAGRVDEARDSLVRYVETSPENPWGHYLLGLAHYRKGDLAAANRAFDRSIELNDQNAKSFFNSGRTLLALGRNHEAFERVESGLLLDSASVDGLRLLARAHARLGNIDGALASYRRALVIDDGDGWTLNNLGVLYLEEGNPEAALGPLARGVLLRPTAPIFQNNLGQALEQTGRGYAAKRAYQAAVKADPTYLKAVKNLERISLVVTDSTPSDGVIIEDLAEEFRLQVGMWKDSVPRPAVDSVVSDSLPPATH